MGDLADARGALEAALASEGPPDSRRVYFAFDYHSWAGIARLTTLWLQGYPAQARAAIHQSFQDAEAMQHPVSLAIVLNAVATLLWISDLDVAEDRLDWFIARAVSQSFAPYLHVGHAFKGEVAIRRGDVDAGAKMLQSHLERLHAARNELFTARFHIILAGGLAAGGRFAAALSMVDEAAELIEAKGYTSYLPELLRLKGSVLLAASESL